MVPVSYCRMIMRCAEPVRMPETEEVEFPCVELCHVPKSVSFCYGIIKPPQCPLKDMSKRHIPDFLN